MSKKILKSGPGQIDETLDTEFDKIFHPEKFDVAQLNPADTGYVDEERKKYYSSSNADDLLTSGVPAGAESEAGLRDTAAGSRGYEPLQDQGIRSASDGNFGHSWDLEGDHSKHDFAHNNPIMTKIKSGHAKHRKVSDPSSDSVRKKSTKKASTGLPLTGISEVGDKQEEVDGIEDEAIKERSAEPESTSASLPWKLDRDDEPVLYSDGKEAAETFADVQDAAGEAPVRHAAGGGGVKFQLGGGGDDDKDDEKDNFEEYKKSQSHRRGSRGSHSKKDQVELEMRRRQGSELKMSDNVLYEADEENLMEGDLEEVTGHRFEKEKGRSRHKISVQKPAYVKIEVEELGTDRNRYGYQPGLDHRPHALFVEMDELEAEEWVERARWIKYEEDLEAERGVWGKPHVASLTFHSLLNLRHLLEVGTLMLDVSVNDLPELLHRVVEDLSEHAIIEEEQKSQVLRVLLYRHKHVEPHQNTFKFGLKRSMSQRSIQGFLDDGKKSKAQEEAKQDANYNNMENGFAIEKDEDHLVVGAAGGLKRNSTQGSIKKNDSVDNFMKARKQDIIACMEEGTEGAIVLVGALDDIQKPIVAFVRLAKAIAMPNTIEVTLPVRFIFILLTPSNNLNMDHHEIGRSFCTLMSNGAFHNVAYRVEEKSELLHAINEFLDDSVVLPPGDWDRKHILPINEIMEMRQRRKTRKEHMKEEIHSQDGGDDKQDPDGVADEGEPSKRNPMKITRFGSRDMIIPFGGLIEDIRKRYPLYLSDLKDGLNSQCIAATIFIYFAALSGAIAFGGLMGAKTDNLIGISETLIVSAVAGMFFAAFSGCPLIIIGTTGPVLLYEEALYSFCQGEEGNGTLPGQFLSWRVWIGIWTFVISLVVAGFQGSTMVRFFTKFTKDIFASLVSLLFIYEAFNKLIKIFGKHPLQKEYFFEDRNMTELEALTEAEWNAIETCNNVNLTGDKVQSWENIVYPQPNTALISLILMFGCFGIAYSLRLFRNSQYFGRPVRRALGDFGVPIAIAIMVLIDYGAGVYTEKLTVPNGIKVTSEDRRGWYISPLQSMESGESVQLAVWAMFAAILPAMLLYVLLFMETHICELIMMEKTKEEKGAGLHLDIVILSLINMVSATFGGPWICAATVRAVSHVSALTVLSTTNAPGEAPKVVGIRDQRVTAFCVSLLLGLSILMSPILKQVPFAVLFGVFLYMGVSGTNGVQFFDRLALCFMPVKHHPSVSYVKRVKTRRMILFTIMQGLGLILLWVVKSTAAALAFPFFVVAMIPYRMMFKYIFTRSELDALDGPQAGKNAEDCDECDFYETANEVPINPSTSLPLHRSLMGIVKIPARIGGKGNKK